MSKMRLSSVDSRILNLPMSCLKLIYSSVRSPHHPSTVSPHHLQNSYKKPARMGCVSVRLHFHTSLRCTSDLREARSRKTDTRLKEREQTVLTLLSEIQSQESISGRNGWPRHRSGSSRILQRAWRVCMWTSCP